MARDDNDALKEGTLDTGDPLAGLVEVETPPADHEPLPPQLTLGDLLAAHKGKLTSRLNGTDKPIATPWPSLNEKIGGGLWPGELTTISGTTGSGKTQFALQLAIEAARTKVPVLYVALEMSELDALCRVAALLTDTLAWSTLWKGQATSDQQRAAAAALTDGRNLPLAVRCETPGTWDACDLDRLVTETSARLVILDYLQLVGGDQFKDTRTKIAAAAYKARDLARNKGLAVVIVSSVGRDKYGSIPDWGKEWEKWETDKGTNKAPNPGDLVGVGKEAGEIEFAAGTCLVVATKWAEKPEDRKGLVVAAKVRAGIPGALTLRWDGCRFTEQGTSTSDPRSII